MKSKMLSFSHLQNRVWPTKELQKNSKGRLLKEKKPEKFLARDFVDCIKNMGDYVPVYEIIRQMAEYEGTEDARELTLNITAREQQLVRQLQSAKELPLYVTMLGDSGN